MISVCQIYTDFKGANNTWSKGHFRPQSFIYGVHEASLEIFNEKRKEWQKSNIISDDLRPFIKSVQVPIKNLPRGGLISYPADYSLFASARFYSKSKKGGGVMCKDLDVLDITTKKCTKVREEDLAEIEADDSDNLIEHDIDKIDNSRWGAFCDHEFLGPSIDNPGCTQYDEGFKVLPKNLGVIVLDYLAVPERPTFIYTTDTKHNIICDLDKCVNLLWGQEMLPELMSRIKTKYASFIGDTQKYAEGAKETANAG